MAERPAPGATAPVDAALPLDFTLLDRCGDGPLIVALSGGLDSGVLLHALAHDQDARRRGLRALHVHHGLHADADRWAVHCASMCESVDVPLDVEAVVVRDAGLGREGDARAARHAAFGAYVRDGAVLALAHHLDDQAETFLLRALRASGPDGLAAMRPLRPLGAGWLWRPLLALPRARLLGYARHHGLSWFEDPANADLDLDRNFLRHRLLPLLRERWPNAAGAFARSACLAQDSVDLLDAGDADALAAASTGDPAVLGAQALRALPPPRRARVLRRWIAGLGLPPIPAHALARIESELLPARRDSVAEVEWADTVVHAWRDSLHVERRVEDVAPGWRLHWDGCTPLALPDGGILQTRPAIPWPEALEVSARAGGERIRLPGRRHHHLLKHALQDASVPPWRRGRIPLLWSHDGELLAAGDEVIGERMTRWLHDMQARLQWTPRGTSSGD